MGSKCKPNENCNLRCVVDIVPLPLDFLGLIFFRGLIKSGKLPLIDGLTCEYDDGERLGGESGEDVDDGVEVVDDGVFVVEDEKLLLLVLLRLLGEK